MSYKYWLLFGSLGVGAMQSVACSGEFRSCRDTRTCAPGGAGGIAGAAGRGLGGEEPTSAGKPGSGGLAEQAGEGGSAGTDAEGGEARVMGDDAGSGGMGGASGEETELVIETPALENAKTYVAYAGKIKANGAAKYAWSITSGALPAGLALQGVKTDTATIAGTPTQAGQFPITLSVSDGVKTQSVDVTVSVTHPVLFLSDRVTAGVNELFVAEIGAATAEAPVRLSASLASGGGVSSYAWSPDGSKVLYLATQSSGGATELWVASLDAPGIAQRVSAGAVSVSQITWLKSGNVAAYTTTIGQAYVVDLSSSSVGENKLAVTASTSLMGELFASPNGTSFVSSTVADQYGIVGFDYITRSNAGTHSVTLTTGAPANGPMYSYDGRYAVATTAPGVEWWDLSLAAPSQTAIGSGPGAATWSPNANVLLYQSFLVPGLYRGVFNGGNLTSTELVSDTKCSSAYPWDWSPDGKNALFTCGKDVRGIGDVLTAATDSDFSILPGDFFANSFTDTAGPQGPAWSSDSRWVAVRADRNVNAQYDLQLIRWNAPGVTHRPHANSAGSGVINWAFAQNSESMVFVGTIAPQSTAGLYLAKLPTTGAPSSATLVSAPANAVVQKDISWLPGSRVITYRAIVSGIAQLFALPVAADGTAGTPAAISGTSSSGVTSYQLAPAR